MWRLLGAAVCAQALVGCIDCDSDYYYQCSVVYDPFYGYREICRPLNNFCPPRYRCWGPHCGAGGAAVGCKYDGDCKAGQVCSASGSCTSKPAKGSAPSGGAGGSEGMADDAATSVLVKKGAGGAPTASDDSGAATGAVSGGAGAAGPADSSVTPSSGGTSGSAGKTSGSGSVPMSGGGSTTTGTMTGSGSAPSGGATSVNDGGRSVSGARIPHLDFSCVRDTQCGAGECKNGECYAACESDEECGTADRCSVETGRRLCMPDPNPPVHCDYTSDCRSSQSCLDGACHDPCKVDDDCADPQDRCLFDLCVPDRRPIAECVLNLECSAGLVCLNGRCVSLAAR